MKGTVLYGPGDVRFEERPEPQIVEPTDAIVRTAAAYTWSKDELHKIAETDELHISPLREDGVTYRAPTTISCVAVDDALYVRAYNGPLSALTITTPAGAHQEELDAA
jgi:hypothetical protein